AAQTNPAGGSRRAAPKAWQANPTGSPSSIAVITVTPVPKCPSTCRNFCGSGSKLTALPTVTASAPRLEFIPGRPARGSGVVPRASTVWMLTGADGQTLVRGSRGEDVAPADDSRGLPAHPGCVVDQEPVGAVLDVEAAWRLHVERDHLVIGVPAKRGTD